MVMIRMIMTWRECDIVWVISYNRRFTQYEERERERVSERWRYRETHTM